MLAALILILLTLAACDKKEPEPMPEPELPKPVLENLELGLGNAGIGVIGEDFHFEGDMLAVDKIDKVEVKILPKEGETYSKPWKHEITWDQYKGLKNANIHKHFNIPEDAAEGQYDFWVIVYDENGSRLEVRRDFEIYARANLPVRPMISGLWMHKNWTPMYDFHADKDNYPTQRYGKGDTIQVQANISYVKGDGKLYLLLIRKSASYNPQTMEEVDLSKAIVYDVHEHKNEHSVYDFGNSEFDMESYTVIRNIPDLVIGAEKDNNAPDKNAITGSKAWQTGEYNLVVIYKNFTSGQTIHKTIPFGIDYN
ncbi:DUF4625 domain-containing protein [Dyadobacter flavalbus]|uniref:DUF4625 domain-containing protein n=1 Tax=Dyadobacter flavalbus TaxID=2579942 RepID=A0A5M8QT48_9BACT|nr:DUF4625 domain-containing protein [Dyadobacter flavalbus]KAA6438441.1 DUF4625 domain-containing protein [Dyadobacter flavalbus]